MVLDFLRFCKNYLHPYVRASKSGINYYLLPSSMFTSNLKYVDYIFSLSDTLKKNKDDEKVITLFLLIITPKMSEKWLFSSGVIINPLYYLSG